MTKKYTLIRGVDTLDEEMEQSAVSVSSLYIARDRRLATRVIGSIRVYFEKLVEAEALAEERIAAIKGWVEHQKLIYQRLRDGLEEYLKTSEYAKIVSDIGQAYLSNNPDKFVVEGTDEELVEFCKQAGWAECIKETICKSALRKRMEEEHGQKEIYLNSQDPESCKKLIARLTPQERSLRIRWNE